MTWAPFKNSDQPTYPCSLINLYFLTFWTMKYRSQWPAFILRSNIGSYWLIILKYDVHTSNSLQNIRQNHWTMKYRSQWPTFILRSHVGSYWLIIPKYDVRTSNSLQDIRQNHWTVKYGSCWPSLHDPQVKVTRLTKVRSTICLSCFHKRKVEKKFLTKNFHLKFQGLWPWL